MKTTHNSTTACDTARIVIIDKRTVFRKGLRTSILEIYPQASVFESDSVTRLMSQYSAAAPDILLFAGNLLTDNINAELPDLLKNSFKHSKTIIYCTRASIMSLSPFHNKSVYGYIPDDFDEPELQQCLLAVMAGKKYISPDLVWEYLGRSSEQQQSARTEKLSKSEGLVANLLVEGKSVSSIAQSMGRNISTISTQKANIFRKMKVKNIIELARLYG